MKLGFCTDSHDRLENLRKAMLEFHRREVEAVIHCGDFVAPFTVDALKLAECPVYGIYGNCDGERAGLKQRFRELQPPSAIFNEPHLFQFGNTTVAAMHHPDWLDAFARPELADIVVYGHLHKLHIEHRPPWIINPGEVFGLKGEPTVVCFDTVLGKPEVIHLDKLP